MENNNTEIKVKQLLLKRNMTIKTLCENIGITENGLYKMLKNGSIRMDTLGKIASVLNVPLIELFPDSFEALDLLYSQPYYGVGYTLEKRVNKANVDIKGIADLLQECLRDRIETEKSIDTIIQKSIKEKTYSRQNIIEDLMSIISDNNYKDVVAEIKAKGGFKERPVK
jgi:transcriptional regulator with XRE-family HTH domain